MTSTATRSLPAADAQFEVTHFCHQSCTEGWTRLPIIVRKIGEPKKYYYGHDRSKPVSQERVFDRTGAGALVALKLSHTLDHDKCLWLAPDGKVWLASETDPEQDVARKLVHDIGPRPRS